MTKKKYERKDFTANADDLDNFYCIPAIDFDNPTPYCSDIGKTKAYCIYCDSIQEFSIVFFDRDYTLAYICNGHVKSRFGCNWMFAVNLDKINTQKLQNVWKQQPRRTIYDVKE